MVDFTALLDRKADDIEKPATTPTGSYLMTIVGYTTGESQNKKTPYVETELKILAPQDDVDMEEYAKVKNPQERSFKVKHFITEDSLFRLKDFLAKAGFETEGKSFTEMLSEIAGHQIIGVVSHRLGQDGETVYPEINKFLKAE